MIDNVKTAKRILSDCYKYKSLAFVFGNGINRYGRTDGANVSWGDMLINAWEAVSKRTVSEIGKGISFTEFYNIMELESTPKVVRENIVRIVDTWRPTDFEKMLQERLAEIDCPVLTTNFDGNIETGLTRYSMEDGKKFTDYYPWSVYYSNRRLYDPLDGFAVWHINGTRDYPRSLRLSLSEYVNLITRARKYIHNDEAIDNFAKKDVPSWNGHYTWLHLIFNSNLCFIGLGLDEQETFLRWLLIERIKYFRKFPERKKKAWYVCSKKDKPSEGKRMFLEYLGFEVICLPTYKNVYEGLLMDGK